MVVNFDKQKLDLLLNVKNLNENIYTISQYDIQSESIDHFGRLLNDNEIEKVMKLLEYGIGENLLFIYDAVFSELKND